MENMGDRQKKIRVLLLAWLSLMGFYLIWNGMQILQENGWEKGKLIAAEAYAKVGREAAAFFLPSAEYEEGDEQWMQGLTASLQEQLPFLAFLDSENGKTVILEDDSTNQAIIEENERMIRQRLEEENRKKAAEQENQQAAEQNDSQEGQIASESPEGSQSGQAASGSQDSGQNGQTASGSQDSGQSGQMASGSQDSSQNGQDVQETSGTSRWQDQLQPAAEIPLESLQNYDYLLNEFFVVDPNTTTDSSQINVEELMGRDMTLEKDSGQPQILIYHTHSQEEFVDSVAGDVNTTVIGVGEYLAQILRDEYGYQVIHNTDTFDLVDGQLDRSKAYNYAEPVITQILNENPSIEIVIDLHRDGVDESKHLVTEVNGKPTAQVMFFNGLSRTAMNGNLDYLPNPYIEDNLAFSFQLEYLAKQYFPDYTRCIYLKGYRYNLHVRPRSLLLEVGAQTNTVEEAMNAMEPFAWLLNRVLQGG